MAEKSKRKVSRRGADQPQPQSNGDNSGKEMPEVEPIVAETISARSALVAISDVAIAAEKVRIGLQVRKSHLALRGVVCRDTLELLELAREFEAKVDARLAARVRTHPASPWFTRVKGTGGEAVGKVIGYIEEFGRFYDIGDPWIPSCVIRPAVKIRVPANGNPEEAVEKEMVWVEGIERLTTPSKLRKYAGLVPGQRPVAGEKLGYNADLRVMLWRLGGGLIKANGKYHGFYSDYRERKLRQFAQNGIRVLPTPKGRFCPVCERDFVVKTVFRCPQCGGPLGLKTEPEGVVWQGHLHAMCQRRMTSLFLDHLWVVWRRALGLPLRDPYPIEYLGHSTVITPEMMADREE